ncbi:MAG: DUF11 domain-containing protein, partial [Bacteroidia bacterium]|nr:DUF11 domain-containing protein [Bacteroidia bacterium]
MKLLQNLLVALLAVFLCSSFSFAQTSDLELTLQISDLTPDEGQIIEFEYVVENLGPDNATNIQVDDLLPTGFTYDSDDSGGLYNSVLDILNLATLNDGAKFTLKLNAYANAGTNGTVLTALGSITSLDQSDPDSSNDSVNLDITINYPDLEVTKIVDEPNPDEGMTIEYTITVEHLNTTNLSATNILIEDILSTDLTYVSDDSGGNYDSITGIWTVGTLTAGQDSTITITAIVNSGTSGKSIDNIAQVLSFDQNDLNTANDQSNALINVTTADLAIIKTVDDSAPDELQLVEFTIDIENNGPSFANNIMALDLLPPGLTYVSDDGGGSYDNTTGIWTVGNLTDGDSAQLIIQATVDAGTAAQTITNNASITSFDQVDDNTSDNTASADLFVNGADLEVVKSVSDTNPAVNDVITYTIVVTNNGPLNANDITIEDILAP